jgi:hypothetical protein
VIDVADTRGIRAGRAFVELGVSDKLSAGLKAAQKKLEAFGAGLRSIGTKMAGIGVAAITALLGTAKVFSDTGDVLDKMSQRTGVSVEALSSSGTPPTSPARTWRRWRTASASCRRR